VKLETGDLICVERKRKDKRKNKWFKYCNVYIVFNPDKAMRFRSKKPIEIKIQDEIDKGYRVEKVRVNINDMLKYWKVEFKLFDKEFFRRAES